MVEAGELEEEEVAAVVYWVVVCVCVSFGVGVRILSSVDIGVGIDGGGGSIVMALVRRVTICPRTCRVIARLG